MSETYWQRQSKIGSACAKWLQVWIWQLKEVGRPPSPGYAVYVWGWFMLCLSLILEWQVLDISGYPLPCNNLAIDLQDPVDHLII